MGGRLLVRMLHTFLGTFFCCYVVMGGVNFIVFAEREKTTLCGRVAFSRAALAELLCCLVLMGSSKLVILG